jgi:hypothetical protein
VRIESSERFPAVDVWAPAQTFVGLIPQPFRGASGIQLSVALLMAPWRASLPVLQISTDD